MGIRGEKYEKLCFVKPDPLRVTSRRKIVLEENAVKKKSISFTGLHKNRSKANLPKCISMWKNQTSEIVPLKIRILHDRAKDFPLEINTEMFMELKVRLDEAESLYIEGRDIKCIREDDKPTEVEEEPGKDGVRQLFQQKQQRKLAVIDEKQRISTRKLVKK